MAFLTDNGLRIKSTPATGGGARRIVFRDNALREVGTKNKVKAGSQTFSNNNNGNPFILTLAYSAGSNEFENAANCAQYSDIAVQRVTVDNGNSATGSAMLKVDGYDGTDASLGYPETFHVNLVNFFVFGKARSNYLCSLIIVSRLSFLQFLTLQNKL